jgi:hypothetical protein
MVNFADAFPKTIASDGEIILLKDVTKYCQLEDWFFFSIV